MIPLEHLELRTSGKRQQRHHLTCLRNPLHQELLQKQREVEQEPKLSQAFAFEALAVKLGPQSPAVACFQNLLVVAVVEVVALQLAGAEPPDLGVVEQSYFVADLAVADRSYLVAELAVADRSYLVAELAVADQRYLVAAVDQSLQTAVATGLVAAVGLQNLRTDQVAVAEDRHQRLQNFAAAAVEEEAVADQRRQSFAAEKVAEDHRKPQSFAAVGVVAEGHRKPQNSETVAVGVVA